MPLRRPIHPSPPALPDGFDESVILRHVPWEHYEALRADDDRPGLRMTYLDGVLEITSPSPHHEISKTLLARLVEAYADEREIPLTGAGSTTFRDRLQRCGLEPDECYFLGTEERPDEAVPDFAIEIALTSGGIDKLEVYHRLGVPEVWFWVRGKLYLYGHEADGYAPRERSAYLPELDLAAVAAIVDATPHFQQSQAVRAFRKTLRGQ